ncbi:IS481 family transposase [Pseudomonas sp. BN417]|uniref:IS481 family transposase n=1 Tax=Pseudomonas sp. BN417 TaxID=2567890 RepID=UPI0024548A80|nr:IS481 family transposase [Pseudomonas sp. BN417]MDH4554416.1 IS481 family transposase [Pseudomonas sp. BN417]MDH4554439.1 IS481 family transposase [Pseudomonas sp. BN417]MDH4554443.1 IS481 family transposase [Pseudomonas sp. BN417]MDH4558226.1 IS481 family transposase [Pseudomonas sp. BN417]
MPWQECSTMSIRREFVRLAEQPQSNVRELCRRYGISPKTAYKWLQRHREHGEAGLQDRSRRPQHSPGRSDPRLEEAVVQLHRRFPFWGARKLRSLLPAEFARPHHSTIDAILRRQGCQVRYHAETAEVPATQRFEHAQPNELWQMDFKGHFHLNAGGSPRCHPLTLLDDHSRFALCLEACEGERLELVRPHLIQVFRRYGLPRRITADNGPPWGSNIAGGLSALEVWLMRLGIEVSHSRPHHPQTQGKLERFHQTLKREVLHRAFRDLAHCQQAMAHWREQYNHDRPHEALGQLPPITRYQPSRRSYPEQLPELDYEASDRVLKVGRIGQINFQGRRVFVGGGLYGERVAIRPTAVEGVYDVVFIHKTLRQLDLRQRVT